MTDGVSLPAQGVGTTTPRISSQGVAADADAQVQDVALAFVTGGVRTRYGTGSPFPVAVSGTVTVTGGLTDAQLRATPVPISVSGSVAVTGTFFQATQPVSIAATVTVTGPLTDTQLRATPVPVSGTVTTGGLTDTQLRATPVPVSGTVAVTGTFWQATQPVSLASLPALATGSNAIGKLAANSGVDIGDVDVLSLPSLPAGNNNIGDVDIASSVTLPIDPVRATTGAAPSAFTSTTSAQIFASNAARKLFTIYNNSDKDCYVMLAAAAASATSYHVIVKANGGFFSTTDYTGEIRGIMAASIVTGQVNPGEYT